MVDRLELEVIQVIRTKHPRGDGINTVMREVTTLWHIDGRKIIEMDPCPDDSVEAAVARQQAAAAAEQAARERNQR